ncbi:MAG: SDR family oxidoreductase [Clostridiaceae bacterium]|nr:SDR family oxidoreductase [Clostridiaceae bacterium]
MKRIIVLGAAGMAGHMISLYLKTINNYHVIDVCHTYKPFPNSIILDIHDLLNVESLIKNEKPDIIINCIGILNKGIDKKIPDAIFVNSYFPKWLEKFCINESTKIIHISTDCVFSGKTGGHTETAIPDGSDPYARTKVLGEIINKKDLTIRTSIIGPELKQEGIGLFHWFLNQKGDISGYSKVYWTGVTTLQLAICIDTMIRLNLSGLYHLVPSAPINKYELLCIIKEVFCKEIRINKDYNVKCSRTLVDTRNELPEGLPGYEEMICQLKNWMKKNHKLYDSIYSNLK